MTSVIVGDIIKSRTVMHQDEWLNTLKDALAEITVSSSQYEIFRGDSFQLECSTPANAFVKAIYLKACIKQINGLDVRLAIGIGEKSYEGASVSESQGSAFERSGHVFETLKKDRVNLKISSGHKAFDREFNLYFKLALIAMDNWTVNSAEIVKLSLDNPDMIQAQLAELIGVKQDAVSKRQKRAYWDELQDLDAMYRQKISEL
ncbi:SatD family protein [Winogradskyella maritima]|uniref:SatD family protein n=1 Tax=Winogradskyella maritima TaxID=1517766 RepID=A0ABV8AH67_9FLAO|nr:SatD family protein [Winogradskyella maritima]